VRNGRSTLPFGARRRAAAVRPGRQVSKHMVLRESISKGHLKYPPNHRHEEPTQVSKARGCLYKSHNFSQPNLPHLSKELYRDPTGGLIDDPLGGNEGG
jgi:hypothetical protein